MNKKTTQDYIDTIDDVLYQAKKELTVEQMDYLLDEVGTLVTDYEYEDEYEEP